jgi:hypothetical protein
MKPNLRALYREAAKVLGTLLAMVVVIATIGCGDGGGDGAEDTGTLIEASVSWPDPQTRNIDISPDDTDNDGTLDVFLTDKDVTIEFVNKPVVPPDPTGGSKPVPSPTDVQVQSYTIEYFPAPNNLSAPALITQQFNHTFVIRANATVSRGDILVVALASVSEFVQKLAAAEQNPPEYTAHYTFHMENLPFNQSMTVTLDVPISFADFIEGN